MIQVLPLLRQRHKAALGTTRPSGYFSPHLAPGAISVLDPYFMP